MPLLVGITGSAVSSEKVTSRKGKAADERA